MASKKACRLCGQVLPLEGFHRDSAVARDGRKTRCKKCSATAQKARLTIPEIRDARREHSKQWNQSSDGRMYHRAYKQSDRYKAQEKSRRAEPRNVFKVKAREAINATLRYGHITKGACAVCGDSKTQAHHAFVYKPENWKNIVWLCSEHHQKEEERLRKEREHNATLS